MFLLEIMVEPPGQMSFETPYFHVSPSGRAHTVGNVALKTGKCVLVGLH